MNTTQEKKPECAAFIMDGNRRWAKAQNLPTLEGHKRGYEVMQELVGVVHKEHIPHMICYAFSTENWNRSDEEVSYLMDLMRQGIEKMKADFSDDERKVNFKIVGEKQKLPKDLQKAIQELESKDHRNPELTVWVAISYGGRAEIVAAVNKCIEKGEEIDEEKFVDQLWTNGMPDPDIIIRTSGEYRLSNFLLWQAAYSELFFTKTLWPDFGEGEFQSMLKEYGKRKRRKGK